MLNKVNEPVEKKVAILEEETRFILDRLQRLNVAVMPSQPMEDSDVASLKYLDHTSPSIQDTLDKVSRNMDSIKEVVTSLERELVGE